LNAKYLTYNALIEFFRYKSLGWTNGEHLRKCFKRKGMQVTGTGHQFIDDLSFLLSMLSDHHESFHTFRIKMYIWLVDGTVKKKINMRIILHVVEAKTRPQFVEITEKCKISQRTPPISSTIHIQHWDLHRSTIKTCAKTSRRYPCTTDSRGLGSYNTGEHNQ
jgi:hypothetical protein